MPEANNGKSRRILLVTIASILTVIVTAMLAELLGYVLYQQFRAYHVPVKAFLNRGEPSIPNTISHALWGHAPNPEYEHHGLNEQGTRGPGFDPVKKEIGEFRIIVSGDSATEGTGVNWDMTYAYHLERFLQEMAPDRKITVINAGVAGHKTTNILAYIAHRLVHLQPDVIVVKAAYNDYVFFARSDLSASYTTPVKPMQSKPTMIDYPGPSPFWTVSYLGKSYVAYLYYQKQREHEIRQLQAPAGRSTTDIWSTVEGNLNLTHIYRRQILGILGIIRANGVRPLLLDLPLAEDLAGWPEEFRHLVGQFNVELAHAAKQTDTALIRSEEFLDGYMDFLDHCHTTSQGNQRIAAALANHLSEDLGLSNRVSEVPLSEISLPDAEEAFKAGHFTAEETLLRVRPDIRAAFAQMTGPGSFTVEFAKPLNHGLLNLAFELNERMPETLAAFREGEAEPFYEFVSESTTVGSVHIPIREPTQTIRLEMTPRSGTSPAVIRIMRLNAWEIVEKL
ncbi:MAG: hypothetical protein HOH43_11690 [Candidatus Latescibacteria bacterium]|jgi:lysophospholipase L1-like esterase|nr:hypothetical protein [Candidatus Latescibacterota bacterium]